MTQCNKCDKKNTIQNYRFHRIKFVIFQRADLAICDLTITHERRSAVDFTTPFMNLGKEPCCILF